MMRLMAFAISLIAGIAFAGELLAWAAAWECSCDNCELCCDEWALYEREAYDEYAAEFTALFNSLSVARKETPKGIRITVRRPNGRIARSTLVKVA